MTAALALGFQAVAAPLTALRAAMRWRAWPPMVVNVPARVDGRARDGEGVDPLLALGFQAVAAPLTAPRAAMPWRVWPPMVAKSPPA